MLKLILSVAVIWFGVQVVLKAVRPPEEPVAIQPEPVTISQPEEVSSAEPEPPAVEPDWKLRLVNRWNPVPEGYEVELAQLPNGEKVDKRIYEPLMEMLEAAKEGNWGELPIVASGYRTPEQQQKLYEDKIGAYTALGYSESQAEELTQQWVAPAGYSEHQLGIAVDINGATYDVFLWLQANSYRYGFIFRYPGGKTDITGVAQEVWHYRYVGAEAAAEIYEQGVCLEEYLESRGG